MKSSLLNISMLTACVTLMPGCGISYFAHRDTNPTIQDVLIEPNLFSWLDSNSVNTFSTTASRRMVITKIQEGDKFQSCAEPSPDVGEAFMSAISDALKLAATDPHSGINGSLSNEYARAATTQIAPLIYRTQSLQIYRDAIHSHCIDMMNGWYGKIDPNVSLNPKTLIEEITTEKTVKDGKEVSVTNTKITTPVDVNNYNQMKLYYFSKAMDALKNELPQVIDAQKVFFQNQKSTGVPINTVTQIADAIKGAGSTTITSTPTGTTIISSPNGAKATTPKCSDDSTPKYCKTPGTEPDATSKSCSDNIDPKFCKDGTEPK